MSEQIDLTMVKKGCCSKCLFDVACIFYRNIKKRIEKETTEEYSEVRNNKFSARFFEETPICARFFRLAHRF